MNKFGLKKGDLVRVEGWGKGFFKIQTLGIVWSRIITVKYGKGYDVETAKLRPYTPPKKRYIKTGWDKKW